MTSIPTSGRAPWPAAISVPLSIRLWAVRGAAVPGGGVDSPAGRFVVADAGREARYGPHCSTTFFLLAGMPLRLRGMENLPAGQCVVVANHASYLDGVVMTAALPPRFGFVIKREMNDVPVAGLLLRRIGSEFVERFNRHKGGTDARRVLRTAASGSLAGVFSGGDVHAGSGAREIPHGCVRDRGARGVCGGAGGDSRDAKEHAGNAGVSASRPSLEVRFGASNRRLDPQPRAKTRCWCCATGREPPFSNS
jgi:1-acyl-sn-glycerol-3-phosphate acyltransferase